MRFLLVLVGAVAVMAADLPVKRVILYKNGIGYFQRSGELTAGETGRLEFKADQMNDVLKSLTVLEEGNGKITGLRYDSSEPLEAKLAEFPFHYGAGAPLSAFLDQLRGARVELSAGGQTVAGIIVSARETAAEQNRPRRDEITVMLDSGELRVLDLSGVSGIKFPDPMLQTQLRDFLATIARSRGREKRAVYIDSTDSKARRVSAYYVVPTPTWKSSYRLSLKPQAGEPVLEGWAIVDNTTGEDWQKVTLAVVSGKPVSFITNLYEPRYTQRETAELEEMAAAKPMMYGGVVGGVPGGMAGGVIGGIMGRAKTAAPPPPPPAPQMRLAEMRDVSEAVNVTSSVAATTIAREAGELFEYRFDTPVTVRKGESAMLPFVQQPVGARKLLIFSRSGGDDSEHPRNAVELTNSTTKVLDGGPVTVFDSGSYAGEALMDTLKADEKRLISYAVDLGTRVSDEIDSTSSVVREVHMNRGVLTARRAVRTLTTYTAFNADAKPKTLIIEHAIVSNTKLVNPKPLETTKDVYRFEMKLAPRASEKLAVTADGSIDEVHMVTNLTPDFLAAFVQNKELSDLTRNQIAKVATQKSEVARMRNEIAPMEQQRNELVSEQGRLRENIRSLSGVAGQQDQVQAYSRRLGGGEGELTVLRDKAQELRQRLAAAEATLNHMIETMEF
ncbi:MAG TPA: DUF4139 domain-containing protein [Bryobacteraceae bacterium]|nr:DUF4139 domain-containing protein [Bryobacteraceae bacterium]